MRLLLSIPWVAPLRDGIPTPANGGRCRATVTSLRSLVILMLALGCGPTALRESGTTPTLSLGDASRRIETLTDLEEVRDVVMTGDSIYAATDGGLFRFLSSGDAPPERVEGLPSQDVRGLVEDEGALLVVTAGGVVSLASDAITPVEGAPSLGHLTDAARTADGTVWLCGLGGLARRAASGWEIFGDPVRCTTLAPTPEGQLWAGTTAGLLYIEGDVLREHPISGGMPEGYVRAVVPVQPGKIMAILDGPSASRIAYWDGERWYAYTIRGLAGRAVGLVRRGSDVLLVGEGRVIAIAPRGRGVPLAPLSNSEGTVRSFRPRATPAAQHSPAETPSADDVLKEPLPLAQVPENAPTISAPPFVAEVLEVELPGRAYASFVDGADAFIAIANGGVLRLPANGAPRVLGTRTLVPEGNLQLATDSGGTVWMLAADHQLAKRITGRLRRVTLPEGLVAQAISRGPEGAYMTALDPSAPGVVRIFRNAGRGWSPLAQRTLELPTALTGIPFMGVAPNGHVWLALEVQREDGAGRRTRGLAVIDPSAEAVVYHHRAADRERGGLPVPDEVSAIDFDTDGNAWLASLSGLVRVGSAQAVVFGEARGVRGEVVSDVAVGNDVVWVASAEGLASYDRTRFDYAAQPASVQQARPDRLTTDTNGNLWGVSSRGLVHRSDEWQILDASDGLPSELADVASDEAGNLWLLTPDRVVVLAR